MCDSAAYGFENRDLLSYVLRPWVGVPFDFTYMCRSVSGRRRRRGDGDGGCVDVSARIRFYYLQLYVSATGHRKTDRASTR